MSNKSLKIVLIAIGFVLMFLIASILYDQLGSQMQNQQMSDGETTQAVDFTVYDVNGKAVKLSDYKGTPIVVNFWASWCGPCKGEMPEFNEVYNERKNEVQFMMVNMTDGYRETVDTASEFIKGEGYSFPVFFDTDYSASEAYNVMSLPTTYFIDENGNIVSSAIGAINKTTLESGIEKIIER